MAALGLYGVIRYSVALRTPEIGIRLALGAQRREVLWLVVRQGLRLTVVGLVAGTFAALASSQLLASQLYGTGVFDPLTFAAMTATLLVAALLASYVPARRATRVDPLAALRSE
jgi:putative ABC transport system permease protein